MALPLHSRLRQHIKNGFSALLSRLLPSRALIDTPIESNNIQRILLIRINYRIGNILFTTPLIKALEMRFPHAKIDVLIGAAYPVPLLTGFSTIGTINTFARGLLKNPLKAYQYIAQMRSTQYDLVVSLNSGSASDRLATALVRGRIKLGFVTHKDWAPYTHMVTPPQGTVHEALKPLYLMQAFGNKPADYPQEMDIALSPSEKAAGLDALKQQLQAQGYVWQDDGVQQAPLRIGMFRDARFEKKLADSWWQTWHSAIRKLLPNAIFIDILSPDVPVKLTDDVYSLSEKNLRHLGAMLSQLDAFVCADTGPMHLASASKAPTIALFNATAPTMYGTLGARDVSLEIAGLTEADVAQRVVAHLQQIATMEQ